MADGGASIIIERTARVRTQLVADLFCGAGGMSTGAERALRDLGLRMSLVGVNHWPVAIETNRRNHPEHAARIACANLETALPLDHVPEGRLDLLMAAPSCVFHSRARGGRPVHDQQRMDPWHVVRWCTELRVKRLLVENVPEIMDWGPCSLVTGRPIKSRRGEYFRAWVAALQAIGMRIDYRVLCCADHGDPTTRRRFFLMGRSDGGPLEWPDPTHAPVGTADLLGRRERWRGAREVIDWTMTGSSIFTRKRPLRPNTIRRILAGAAKYRWPQPYVDALQALLDGTTPRLTFSRAEAVELGLVQADPMLVTFRGTHEHALTNGARSTEDPVPTLTAGGGHLGLVLATASGGAARDLDEPLPTITTGGAGGARPGCARPQLVEPLIVPVSNSSSAGVPRSVEEPIRTVTTAKGGDQAMAIPLVAPYYGGGSGLTSTSVGEPVPAVTTKARFGLAEPFLVPNFGEREGQVPRTHGIDEPMPTITASGHVQLAAPAAVLSDVVQIDVNYRMLHWRELARATSFDDEGHVYDFAGTATEITKQIGNAVPNRTAKALVRSLMRDAAAAQVSAPARRAA
jgi:DNA (cytosine-5)-methyltransferase 1